MDRGPLESQRVATRDIRPSTAITVCDVCGRTLLRGEHAEVYLDGGARRQVCELCKSRALHEGWVREGTVPTYDAADAAANRRGSFLTRLRRRREPRGVPPDDEMAMPEPEPEPEPEPRRSRPSPRPAPAPAPAPAQRAPRRRTRDSSREPRHVRAVPMGADQKIASAIELFNNSEHRRTVAGVARSLGAPEVSIHPNEEQSGRVDIVAAWELCWYRYEVDLSDEVPVVRVAAQGYELDELSPREREANASYDEHGALGVA